MWDHSPSRIRRISLAIGVGSLLLCLISFCTAASNELQGKAVYRESKGSSPQRVTREASPIKFRKAQDSLFGCSVVFLFLTIGGFTFHHKLNEQVD